MIVIHPLSYLLIQLIVCWCHAVHWWRQSLMTVESRVWTEKVTQFTKRNSKQEVRDTWTCYCDVLSCLGKNIPQDRKIRKKMWSTAVVDAGSWTCWWMPENWKDFSTDLYFIQVSSGFRLHCGHSLHGGRGLINWQLEALRLRPYMAASPGLNKVWVKWEHGEHWSVYHCQPAVNTPHKDKLDMYFKIYSC